MAKFILRDASVTVNAIDLSDHVESVEISISQDDVDITAMGATAKQHARGLRDDKITINFFQDFDASKVEATLYPLLTSDGFSVVVKPTSGAVSSTNPSYTATCLLLEYSPLAGSIGDASKTQVTFQATNAIVKATV